MKYNNQDGVTLVMILTLLVVASILIGSLFTVVRSHINTVSREEANVKAFYNADSGVEFVRASAEDINFTSLSANQKEYLQFNEDNNLVFDNPEYFFDENNLDLNNSKLKFSLKAIKNNDVINFTSRGSYQINGEEITKDINFELESNRENFNKLFNVRPASDDLDLKGKASSLDDILLNLSEEIYPDWDDWQILRDKADNWSNIKKNGNWNTYTSVIAKTSGNLKLNNKDTFVNSIIFIDGDLTIGPQTEWENSLIIINGNLKVNGFPTHGINNSVFFTYNTDTLHLAGNFPDDIELGIDFNNLPAEFDQVKDKLLIFRLETFSIEKDDDSEQENLYIITIEKCRQEICEEDVTLSQQVLRRN
ncbi:hypothetical protein C8C77_12157 [Halanaerobium saccharolyticum]|uniref:Uncharacterized protein n=1 Tax=Halanaerobium saccharolyticum TaxID=43595 RepID=A0A4R7YU74_9FIRM|nr:hypothetical protein [Halanaerobium saccharolyticum]RAK06721.1 hypothetical protein C7958_12057 [Halanaerobium saccharolyticum]TDW01358.1 hypothetical protein C8C77_12157 [Halanaerobium saccharolyticum]TDX52826.1 hypothetical protein C7956_12157 [Halanaerobium saccharolyticum]